MRAELAAFLDSSGIVFGEAPCWTTAAPFRTTADEVAYYAEHGVRAVEEEVAALFVVGSSLNIQTAATLVLDGVPSGDGSWRIDLAAAQQSLQRLFTASIDFAAKLYDFRRCCATRITSRSPWRMRQLPSSSSHCSDSSRSTS